MIEPPPIIRYSRCVSGNNIIESMLGPHPLWASHSLIVALSSEVEERDSRNESHDIFDDDGRTYTNHGG